MNVYTLQNSTVRKCRQFQQWKTTPFAPAAGVESELWCTSVVTATMSEAERAAYEDKKLKMRKAMGENLGDAVPGETRDAAQRRCHAVFACVVCYCVPRMHLPRSGAGA